MSRAPSVRDRAREAVVIETWIGLAGIVVVSVTMFVVARRDRIRLESLARDLGIVPRSWESNRELARRIADRAILRFGGRR